MEKVSLTELLAKGDVIRIVDAADSDYGNLFVYRGRKSGYYVLDEIAEVGTGKNPVAVKDLKEHVKLFKLSAPDPSESMSDIYAATLEDLSQNSSHLEEALELGLSLRYDRPEYKERDLGAVNADFKKSGRVIRFDIKNSGFLFTQEVPKDSLFNHLAYRIYEAGVFIDAGISFWRLDGAFGLGYKDKDLRYRTGKMTDEERRTPVFDRERLGEIFEELKQKGIFVFDLSGGAMIPTGTWDDGPLFDRMFLRVGIMVAPVTDLLKARTLYFESVGAAQQYVQGLLEQTPKVPEQL